MLPHWSATVGAAMSTVPPEALATPQIRRTRSTPPIHASHVPAGAATAVVLPARPLVPTRQRVPRTHTNSRLGKRPNLTRISLSPALQESDYRKLLDLPPSANRRGSGLRLFLD